MVKKILVPTDGSDHARRATEFATDLALKYNAVIYLMHVVHERKVPESVLEFMEDEHVEESPSYIYLQMVGKKILGMAEKQVKEKGVEEVHSVVVRGDPAAEIINFAKDKGVDMIMIGSRGLGQVKEVLLGSVSSKVCHVADCTCVTVR
jgi:nucleotide-binding universal stress UspA family protein